MAELTQSSGRNHGRVRSKKLSPRIDMTPMVDLAFLLLTFFVLTSTLQQPYVLRIDMPNEPTEKIKQPEVPERNVITFLFDEKDRLYWYKGITDPVLTPFTYDSSTLHAFLEAEQRKNPMLVVLIKAADAARYENLIDMMDEVIEAEIQRYFIVDITDVDKVLLAEKRKMSALAE